MMSIIHHILCLGLFFISATSVAGIQPGSTRVIYPAAKLRSDAADNEQCHHAEIDSGMDQSRRQ